MKGFSRVKIYLPLWKELFEKYGYTWEDIDLLIYPIILKEEGHTEGEILDEMEYIKQLFLTK